MRWYAQVFEKKHCYKNIDSIRATDTTHSKLVSGGRQYWFCYWLVHDQVYHKQTPYNNLTVTGWHFVHAVSVAVAKHLWLIAVRVPLIGIKTPAGLARGVESHCRSNTQRAFIVSAAACSPHTSLGASVAVLLEVLNATLKLDM